MPVTAPARPDGSMSLLVAMMDGTLDDSYRAAAAQRPAATARPPFGARRRLLPVLAVLGLLTGTAAAQVRARADEAGTTRAALVAEVQRRTAASDDLQEQVQQQRAALAREQAAALGTSTEGRRTAQELAALELATGTVPVTGPGLVVRLDDAPAPADPAAPRGGTSGQGRVQDRDLQQAVNGLWAAGAEAVSVDDLRLTALTTIRSAGEAVLVDFRPVSPPYVLRAVGDPARLEQGFTGGPDGRRLATYPDLYGIALSVDRADRLSLPAAGVPVLHEARTP